MKYFGKHAELTELAVLIMAEDIEALEKKYMEGLNFNLPHKTTERTEVLPINLALCENKLKVVGWLLSKKVELNDKSHPSIIMAASNGGPKIVQKLIDHGAEVNVKDRIGKTAMNAALYGKKTDNISVLISNGYKIHEDGVSLRQAVLDRQYLAVNVLLENNIDVNFHQPNMVFPNNPTAIAVAVENEDTKTVNLLLEHGADITLKDDFGTRPYNIAARLKNHELMDLIKSLEPKEWHDEGQKIKDFKKYKLPESLLKLLASENRRLKTSHQDVKYLEFSSILSVKEVHWMNHVFLDLLCDVDNYSADGFLVWYPKKQCLAFADYEHEVFIELCSMEEFIKDPAKQIEKIVG